SSSAPQIDYALMVQHSSEYSPPETGLVEARCIMVQGKSTLSSSPSQWTGFAGGGFGISSRSKNSRVIKQSNYRHNNAAYQANDLDAYDSDCDELNSAKIALMANLSHYGFDNLAE
nr:hypothetical protein [Tanacetum cinerariifolium]